MLETEDRGPARWMTINRPDRMNAIPPDGWEQLRHAFEDFAGSSQRVLVLTGAGGNFCAGADLSADRGDPSVLDRYAGMKAVERAASALLRIPKPVIALVDGVAVGAGMNLALLCDLVIASDRARFSEIFVRRGLTLDFGGSWILPRLVGLQRAKELALSGRMVDAEEAVTLGLALEAVPVEDLERRATELAAALAEQSPIGQMFAKQNLNASFTLSLAQALGLEGQAQAVCLTSADAREGFRAFLEKRSPRFEGR